MRFCAVFQTNFHMKVWARTRMLKGLIDPLTPRSDSHVTFTYDIRPLSSKLVVRVLKYIR